MQDSKAALPVPTNMKWIVGIQHNVFTIQGMLFWVKGVQKSLNSENILSQPILIKAEISTKQRVIINYYFLLLGTCTKKLIGRLSFTKDTALLSSELNRIRVESVYGQLLNC